MNATPLIYMPNRLSRYAQSEGRSIAMTIHHVNAINNRLSLRPPGNSEMRAKDST